MAEASAPASSANLGPGFDSMALALELVCRVVAEPADRWQVTHHGPYRPADGELDAVMEAARAAIGEDRPVALDVFNEIPLGRGLGSSAAAFVAGAAAALRVEGDETPEQVLNVAARLEGHSDNVAAAVHGGLVAVAGRTVQILDIHPSLRIVVAVPGHRLPTKWAREALPEVIDHEAAARSVSRVLALAGAFRSADRELFAAAAGDELHELPRTPLFPESIDLMSAARSAGAVHACWSGAGPSILAVTEIEHQTAVADALRSTVDDEGVVLSPEIARRGLR